MLIHHKKKHSSAKAVMENRALSTTWGRLAEEQEVWGGHMAKGISWSYRADAWKV